MLRPVGDHLLVKPSEMEEMTKSGIMIAASAQQKPQEGTVLAVGTGKFIDGRLVSFEEMGVKIGDVVMFSKYGPTEVKIDGVEYFILDSGDVLGVLLPSKK